MPMKMKTMKGIDLFCASPASTAICSSTDQRSMVRNGHKPLHHHDHHHQYKTFSNNLYNNNSYINHSPSSRLAPCISELPFTPRPSSSFPHHLSKPSTTPSSLRRKSSADVSDLKFICGKSNSPPRGHSSRYLLGDSPFLDSLSSSSLLEPENIMTTSKQKSLALVPSTPVVRSAEEQGRTLTWRGSGAARLGSLIDVEKENAKKKIQSKSYKQTERSTNYCDYYYYGQKSMGQYHSSKNNSDSNFALVKSSSSASSPDQVVVLRVSLHCKGCEGKLRKHLSKMEGVKSFSIDLETKMVTVVGDVTPLGVLTSISKVKYAQLWPSPTSSSSTLSSSSSTALTSDFNY